MELRGPYIPLWLSFMRCVEVTSLVSCGACAAFNSLKFLRLPGEPARTPPGGVLVPPVGASAASALRGPESPAVGGAGSCGEGLSTECVSAVVEVLQVTSGHDMPAAIDLAAMTCVQCAMRRLLCT